MAVKLLMTWDIIQGREQEYFEFVVREFVPGVQHLGIQPTEAWYTTYGRRPQILTGVVADTLVRMELALGTEEWRRLRDRLLDYVINFESRIVRSTGGFQM
ncbi:MAG: hypothetical protein NTU91_10305 [Chloroflexi bacterium]|nr:hypothetical protein [Chloroflexota bacterium]